MKIKAGFILKNVAGSNLIVPIGENLVDFSQMITINETGAFLFEKLTVGAELDELATAMTEEYDIDFETAKADAEKFVELLSSEGMLEQ